MEEVSRRATLLGLGAAGALAGPRLAQAETARAITRQAGFRPWQVASNPRPVPLDLKLSTLDGSQQTLRDYLGHRPAVLILWATWCPPCISEKPTQSFLSRRLKQVKAQCQIKAIQAYDNVPLPRARAVLDQIRAKDLETARASREMEDAFVPFFGPALTDPERTTLPALLLLDAEGRELGRAKGALAGISGQSYWADIQTFQFLTGLDRLLAGA